MADYLEHSKIVLKNVSDNPYLFRKELLKSLRWIKPEQTTALAAWCFYTFQNNYEDVLTEVFFSNLT